jgi:hypothetical protein
MIIYMFSMIVFSILSINEDLTASNITGMVFIASEKGLSQPNTFAGLALG